MERGGAQVGQTEELRGWTQPTAADDGRLWRGQSRVAEPADGSQQMLMLFNLPCFLEELDVKKLICPFGSLAEFNLLKDDQGAFKGAAVFKYGLIFRASNAIGGLNGRQLGDVKLVVQRVPPQMITTLMAPTKTGERPKPPPTTPSNGLEWSICGTLYWRRICRTTNCTLN